MNINCNYKLREHQKECYRALDRFTVLVAHRRFGKTVFAVLVLLKKAAECKLVRPQVHYYAPSYSQAKKVAWEYIKHYTAGTGAVANESELKLTLPTGAIIQLGSADNPDSSRGIYSDYVVLDEPAQMPPRMWTEVLRPALSDRKGGALFIGTPKGRHGMLFDSWDQAEITPGWTRKMYKASETNIIDPDELTAASAAMSRAEYLQEFECSFDAAIKGAYYGEVMQTIEADGHITNVDYDNRELVYLAFDLGVNDSTAIWFAQFSGNRINLVDYREYQNTGLPDMVADLKRLPYTYGKWVMPFDIEVQSLSTGQTRKQTLTQLGVDVVVAPKTSIIDGIEDTRAVLSRCWFDKDKCKQGIEALRQYRSDYDDVKGVLRLKPVHDWTSHGADAMRYLAVTNIDMITGNWTGKLDYSNYDRAIA